ncbi:MAG: hypothetical protein J5805_05065 [Bacteroidaceae bacterium]|nr:hypothetical protein [Bacteroidaceae bacterium]
MKKTFLLSALLLLIAEFSPLKADNITVDGTERSYNVYAPSNLGTNRPLLIFCHGYNQDANWMQNSEFKNETLSMESVCDTAKFVVVFPNGIDRSWDTSGNRDINFVKAIIEKMVTQYSIDRNRVYLGGFSMGGMFTYNAINKMHNQIAAFISCSGPSVVTPSAQTPPVPLFHIQGTADNFGGVQPALNPWINHNGCPTTDKVVDNYNGFSGAKMHTWGPGNDGVEVKLLELKDKGHWICKEPQVYTGKEIWNFCKRYSLEKTAPNVRITSPKSGTKHVCFAPSGEAVFPDLTITATADDPNGTVSKVEFYDGTTLLATCESEPYQVTLTNPSGGKHTLKAVATDNDGEQSTVSVEVTLQTKATYTISSEFTEGGSIPAGWTVYDSSTKRTGYSNGYSLGCRVLQFTGSTKGFNYGLYFRNVDGSARQGYAKFGLEDGGTTLSLTPGHYSLKYKVCNWNMPNFGSVEVNVEKRADNTSIAKQTYTPNINIGNTASNSFGNPEQQTLEFDVTEQGDYVIAFYSADSEWSDCILGQLNLTANSFTPTAINEIDKSNKANNQYDNNVMYDLQGRVISSSPKGIHIQNRKKVFSY